MSRKAKYLFEEKLDVVLRCLQGKTTTSYEATKLGVNDSTVRQWILVYQSLGEEGLVTTSKNTSYSTELKKNAVLDYLNGKGSYQTICKMYGIRSNRQLRDWILKYNSHEELKMSGTGGSTIMTKGRKTTFNERLEIVQYCIANNYNYSETSEKFKISYQQTRNYTLKYEENGIDALKDNRGKRKPKCDMNEVERLRAENKLLRAEKERAKMEVSFLKKLEEIERRRG